MNRTVHITVLLIAITTMFGVVGAMADNNNNNNVAKPASAHLEALKTTVQKLRSRNLQTDSSPPSFDAPGDAQTCLENEAAEMSEEEAKKFTECFYQKPVSSTEEEEDPSNLDYCKLFLSSIQQPILCLFEYSDCYTDELQTKFENSCESYKQIINQAAEQSDYFDECDFNCAESVTKEAVKSNNELSSPGTAIQVGFGAMTLVGIAQLALIM